jgi:hypothetical protein
MKVSELLELLRRADPEARLMFMPPGADEQDAQEVRDIYSSDVRWTHESGVDKGRQYELLYPVSLTITFVPIANRLVTRESRSSCS